MISLVIPCACEQFKFLEPLIKEILKQTLLPNEIVISLSESDKILPSDLKRLEVLDTPFSIKIIKNIEKKTPGENRQIASEKAEYDYIIYQDADDLPHIQRIEIMNYVFENFDANHIMHLVTKHSKMLRNRHIIENIKPHKWNKRTSLKGSPTTAGNIGIHKRVLEKVKWTNHKVGEDTRFTDNVLANFDNCYRLGYTLHLYRTQYSTDHK